MKVWDVNTGKVIEELWPELPTNWYTTVEGWVQTKKDWDEANKAWEKIDRKILYDKEI